MAEFSATIALSSLNGTIGFRLNGTASRDFSGRSVSSAGDINGDGFDDLVIGALAADPNGAYSGSSYVVFGKAAGFAPVVELATLDGTAGFRLDGVAAEDRAGRSVSSVGDVNGDGFDDFVIGAPRADPNGRDYAGSSYVVFGKAGAFASQINLSTLDGNNGFRIDGEAAGDRSGWSVSDAGDVNGDGLNDLIIGALAADPDEASKAGAAYVVFGQAGGFAAAFDLAAVDGSNGFRMDGVAAGDQTGFFVGSAGDVNGDGFDDVIVGAPFADPNGHGSAGASYVVFGQAGGFSAGIDLSALDGNNGFRLEGVAAGDESGYSVASAGDVNGDGFDDLLVGALFADPGGRGAAGSTYVVFGKAGGFTASVALATLDGGNGFRIDGAAPGDETATAVSSAGDVNGDGFEDLIIGAPFVDPNGTSAAGAAFVIFGKAAGFAATVNLSTLDGTNGFRLDGIGFFDNTGYAVSAAGDVNGDGFDDVIVGTPRADPNGHDGAGASFVVFGRAPDAAVTRVGSAAAQTIQGGAFADGLSGHGGDDVLEGRGGGDGLNGGGGNDTASYAHAATGVTASLASPSNNAGDAQGDTYTSIENLAGTLFDDVLAGNGSANRLDGFGGADTLSGGAGDDIYVVDDAGDRVTESVGGGNDLVRSVISFSLDAPFDLGRASVENLILTGAANIAGHGNSLDNLLTGNSGNNNLNGAAGADEMAGGAGNDSYVVDDGGDTIIEAVDQGKDKVKASVDLTLGANVESLVLMGSANLRGTGNTLDNAVTGNSGNNRLNGGAGNDAVVGKDGNDMLTGGAGRDTLAGGADADTFSFKAVTDSGLAASTRDLIRDFAPGIDHIDLSAIDADSGMADDQAFTFIGAAAFSHTAGELRVFQASGDTTVEGDVDGNGIADFQIQLTGSLMLSAGDFLL